MSFLDENNLPLHNGDGGDCIHNVGRMAVLDYLRAEPFLFSFWNRFEHLQLESGELIRHPKQWNDPKDVSSDATEPILMALYCSFLVKHKGLLLILQIWDSMRARGWRYQNGDYFRLHHLSLFGRLFSNKWWTYFGDLCLLLFVIYRQLIGSKLKNKEGNQSVSDDINLILMIRLYLRVKCTFLIKIANLIYNYVPLWQYYFKGRSSLGDYMNDLLLKEINRNGK